MRNKLGLVILSLLFNDLGSFMSNHENIPLKKEVVKEKYRGKSNHIFKAATGQEEFRMMNDETFLNVMGNTKVKMPVFPEGKLQSGYLRGFVTDINGKPLKGAFIGVRSTLGGISGASALTDEKGYYEIKLPYGAITYYSAGYSMNYGGGVAVVGLAPADGNLSGFASASGQIKNFVLLPYGLGNSSEISRQPSNPSNYYGGSIYVDYNVDYSQYKLPGKVRIDDILEITLTSDGAPFLGEAKSFKILKKVGVGGKMTIVNIPVGKYQISAKMQDGRKVRMSETGTYKHSWPAFGLKPDGAESSSTLLFTPTFQRGLNMATAGFSNWQKLSILFEPV